MAVCDFIVEIRKEKGNQYPSSSLYNLLQGLSMYLEREKGFVNKLMSGAFCDICNILDNMMKEQDQNVNLFGMNMRKFCGTKEYWVMTFQIS